MDVNESIVRQVAAKCTARELTGVLGCSNIDRERRFNHYLYLIRGKK